MGVGGSVVDWVSLVLDFSAAGSVYIFKLE